VRSHLDRFVGGATEETIIARVGEGIVSAIGSADSYKDVLENPDRISKAVLAKGLDSNTAFEILSIDIADVDVGDNIGAKLQSEQADADKRIAQAKAEVRRAAAVAVEQEMRAKTQEMRAKVLEAGFAYLRGIEETIATTASTSAASATAAGNSTAHSANATENRRGARPGIPGSAGSAGGRSATA